MVASFSTIIRNEELKIHSPTLMAKLAGVHDEVSELVKAKVDEGKWEVRRKADGSFVTDIDIFADELLKDRLPKLIDAPVRSEERAEEFKEYNRLDSFWLIDPIDNTSGLVEHRDLSKSRINYTFFKNGCPEIAMVSFFDDVHLISADRKLGIFKYDGNIFRRLELGLRDSKLLRFATYRSKLEEMGQVAQSFLKKFDPQTIELKGFSAMTDRFMSLVNGQADVYIEPRPLPWWDISPYILMVQAQGGLFLPLNPQEQGECFGTTLRAPPFMLARKGIDTNQLFERLRA